MTSGDSPMLGHHAARPTGRRPGSTPGCRVTHRAGECNAVPSKKPSGSTKFPPSLARAESEFKKLCNELGGPADIGVTVDPQYMELCCQEHPADSLLPILLRFQNDQTVARRHWPWAAVAISQYTFERSERAEYTDEPKPEEILEILKQII